MIVDTIIFIVSNRYHHNLHSFPTRRSSDLNPSLGNGPDSDGIYVDGGSRILLERNIVHDVDFGIEMASEHFRDRKSTRLNSSHVAISYAVFCLKKKNIH